MAKSENMRERIQHLDEQLAKAYARLGEKNPGMTCWCRECEGKHPHPCIQCGEHRSDGCYIGNPACRECYREFLDTPRGQMLMAHQEARDVEYAAWKSAQLKGT